MNTFSKEKDLTSHVAHADAVDKSPTSPIASQRDDDGTKVRNEAFGRNHKVFMWIGIALMWTIFELDNATIYNFQNYAVSEFEQVSLLGALTTAGTIVSAVLKPSVAKISDVVGRAETYCAAVTLYILSYILCASTNNYNQYAGSYIVYCIGQTSMQILNQLIVADTTSSRWRGLANALVNIPFMVIPWIAAFIADSALETVGWRWGIGIFAIVLPVCSMALIVPLLLFEKRMAQLGVPTKSRISAYNFISQIDLGGMLLLTAAFAMLLLPLAIAGTTPSRWSTPWVPCVMGAGGVLLILLVIYESRVALHPLVPVRFLRNISLVLAWIMGLLDAFAFSVTHTYMYTWATVVHSYSPRDATFLTFTAGCMQVLTGLVTGLLMFKTRYYKWLLVIGLFIRLIGYGVMLRLRGATNSTAELYIVQLIQGAGSGLVQTIVLVVAQVVVPRTELSQSTALELLMIYMGNALGSTAAGAIYTNSFKGLLERQLPSANDAEVNQIFNTFTDITYEEGTVEREAINVAYSSVMRYMTFSALGVSGVGVILVWWLPNLRLSEKHNLAGELEGERDEYPWRRENEAKLQHWWRTGRLW